MFKANCKICKNREKNYCNYWEDKISSFAKMECTAYEPKEEVICPKCKTNTLDKCEKVRCSCKEDQPVLTTVHGECGRCGGYTGFVSVGHEKDKSCCATPHLDNKVKPEGVGEWEENFEMFYDKNECGGSSRWLVAPSTVNVFIKGILIQEKAKWEKGDKRPLPYIDVSEWKRIGQQNQFWDYFLEEEKAKWKKQVEELKKKSTFIPDRKYHEAEAYRACYIQAIGEVLSLIDKL
jgi:hypothetical protein